MTPLAPLTGFLAPYELSPTVVAACGLAAVLYARGRRGADAGRARALAFWVGLGLLYLVLQTHYDYYAQHVFFMHRLQHLVLHHLAPFLLALAAPRDTLAAGLPAPLRRGLTGAWPGKRTLGRLYRGLQQPLLAAALFVAIICLWLIPRVHLYAMLSVPLYDAMNWGMALDGLLFWWMVLNLRRPGSSDARHYGGRILVLLLVMPPQILIGAHIALSRHDLYSVYAVCGRAWPIGPLVDQQLGGLITWIPSAMMSVVAILVLLHRWAIATEAPPLGSGPTLTQRGASCRNSA
jgi:putative membrane protein